MSWPDDLIAEAEALGDSVNGSPENVPTALPRLVEMLAEETDPEVLTEVISALGYAWDEEASLATLPFTDHPDDDVRLAVACSCCHGIETLAAAERVAAVLIELSRDAWDKIRDWATFGLGIMLEIDTPAVRAALVDRLDDEHLDTRHEAVVALAMRKDERAFQPTLDMLTADTLFMLALDAATALADQRLAPALRAVVERFRFDEAETERLNSALLACGALN